MEWGFSLAADSEYFILFCIEPRLRLLNFNFIVKNVGCFMKCPLFLFYCKVESKRGERGSSSNKV